MCNAILARSSSERVRQAIGTEGDCLPRYPSMPARRRVRLRSATLCRRRGRSVVSMIFRLSGAPSVCGWGQRASIPATYPIHAAEDVPPPRGPLANPRPLDDSPLVLASTSLRIRNACGACRSCQYLGSVVAVVIRIVASSPWDAGVLLARGRLRRSSFQQLVPCGGHADRPRPVHRV